MMDEYEFDIIIPINPISLFVVSLPVTKHYPKHVNHLKVRRCVQIKKKDHETNLHVYTSVQFVFFWCIKAVFQFAICLY